jgi:hypothetical protein
MTKFIRKQALYASAAISIGMTSGVAEANDFNAIAGNVINSISNLPTFLSGISYMMGILLGVLGVLKIKDHVENPSQTQLKDGAIRLAAGGGLFALPIVYEAMLATVGDGANVNQADMNAITF